MPPKKIPTPIKLGPRRDLLPPPIKLGTGRTGVGTTILPPVTGPIRRLSLIGDIEGLVSAPFTLFRGLGAAGRQILGLPRTPEGVGGERKIRKILGPKFEPGVPVSGFLARPPRLKRPLREIPTEIKKAPTKTEIAIAKQKEAQKPRLAKAWRDFVAVLNKEDVSVTGSRLGDLLYDIFGPQVAFKVVQFAKGFKVGYTSKRTVTNLIKVKTGLKAPEAEKLANAYLDFLRGKKRITILPPKKGPGLTTQLARTAVITKPRFHPEISKLFGWKAGSQAGFWKFAIGANPVSASRLGGLKNELGVINEAIGKMRFAGRPESEMIKLITRGQRIGAIIHVTENKIKPAEAKKKFESLTFTARPTEEIVPTIEGGFQFGTPAELPSSITGLKREEEFKTPLRSSEKEFAGVEALTPEDIATRPLRREGFVESAEERDLRRIREPVIEEAERIPLGDLDARLEKKRKIFLDTTPGTKKGQRLFREIRDLEAEIKQSVPIESLIERLEIPRELAPSVFRTNLELVKATQGFRRNPRRAIHESNLLKHLKSEGGKRLKERLSNLVDITNDQSVLRFLEGEIRESKLIRVKGDPVLQTERFDFPIEPNPWRISTVIPRKDIFTERLIPEEVAIQRVSKETGLPPAEIRELAKETPEILPAVEKVHKAHEPLSEKEEQSDFLRIFNKAIDMQTPADIERILRDKARVKKIARDIYGSDSPVNVQQVNDNLGAGIQFTKVFSGGRFTLSFPLHRLFSKLPAKGIERLLKIEQKMSTVARKSLVARPGTVSELADIREAEAERATEARRAEESQKIIPAAIIRFRPPQKFRNKFGEFFEVSGFDNGRYTIKGPAGDFTESPEVLRKLFNDKFFITDAAVPAAREAEIAAVRAERRRSRAVRELQEPIRTPLEDLIQKPTVVTPPPMEVFGPPPPPPPRRVPTSPSGEEMPIIPPGKSLTEISRELYGGQTPTEILNEHFALAGNPRRVSEVDLRDRPWLRKLADLLAPSSEVVKQGRKFRQRLEEIMPNIRVVEQPARFIASLAYKFDNPAIQEKLRNFARHFQRFGALGDQKIRDLFFEHAILRRNFKNLSLEQVGDVAKLSSEDQQSLSRLIRRRADPVDINPRLINMAQEIRRSIAKFIDSYTQLEALDPESVYLAVGTQTVIKPEIIDNFFKDFHPAAQEAKRIALDKFVKERRPNKAQLREFFEKREIQTEGNLEETMDKMNLAFALTSGNVKLLNNLNTYVLAHKIARNSSWALNQDGFNELLAKKKREFTFVKDTAKNRESFGSLAGKYVREDIMFTINDADQFVKNDVLPDWMHRTHVFFKKSKTIYNWPTWIVNFISNFGMAAMGGTPMNRMLRNLPRAFLDFFPIKPGELRGVFKDPREAISKTFPSRQGAYTRAFRTSGSIAEGGQWSGDLHRDEMAEVMKAIESMKDTKSTVRALTTMSVNLLKRGDDALVRGYQSIDKIMKIAKAMDDIERRGLSFPEVIESISFSILDYSNLPTTGLLRGLDYVSPFISFPALAIPAFITNLIKRPWEFAWLAALASAVIVGTSVSEGQTTEEFEEEQKALPPHLKKRFLDLRPLGIPFAGLSLNFKMPFPMFNSLRETKDSQGRIVMVEEPVYIDASKYLYVNPLASDPRQDALQNPWSWTKFFTQNPLIDFAVTASTGYNYWGLQQGWSKALWDKNTPEARKIAIGADLAIQRTLPPWLYGEWASFTSGTIDYKLSKLDKFLKSLKGEPVKGTKYGGKIFLNPAAGLTQWLLAPVIPMSKSEARKKGVLDEYFALVQLAATYKSDMQKVFFSALNDKEKADEYERVLSEFKIVRDRINEEAGRVNRPTIPPEIILPSQPVKYLGTPTVTQLPIPSDIAPSKNRK